MNKISDNKENRPILSPSLLSADFGNLQRDIEMINESQADWFHIDIMDGVFVPNISYGFPVLKYIQQHASKPLDVHLMIIDPDRYFERFRQYGADIITVHLEAGKHLHRTMHAIRETGARAGISLNPHSPVALLKDLITETDLVLIMSVNPGYGGQSFIGNTYRKVSELKDLIIKTGSEAIIEVDGGVTLENAPRLIEAGADALVAGNTVFSADDPKEMIRKLKGASGNL